MTAVVERTNVEPSIATDGAHLGRRVAGGVRWGAGGQVVQQVARLVVQICLARLLPPRAFGLMALTFLAVNVGSVLTGGLGLGQALVQRRDLDKKQIDSALGASAVLGVIAAAALFLAAGPLAGFFREPQLAPILQVMSIVFVFKSVEGVPNSMLVRAMQFQGYVVSSVIGTIAGAVVGLGMAVAGAGVWALVGFALTEAFVATAAGWVLAVRAGVWRPGIALDPGALRGLFGYSAAVTGSRLLTYAATNTDNLIVGRVLGATPLGFYGLAYRLMLVPIQRIGDIVAIAVFPAFARAQDDRARLRAGFLRGVRYLSVICLPVTLGTAAAAPLGVPVLFGRQWLPAVPSVQILCLSGPAIVLMRLTTTLLEGIGRAKASLLLMGSLFGLLLPGFLISVHHGIAGVAWTVTLATYVVLLPSLAIVGRHLEASVWDQLRNVLPVLVAVASMVAAIAAAMVVWGAPSFPHLAIVGAIAAASYATVLVALQPGLPREMARALLTR